MWFADDELLAKFRSDPEQFIYRATAEPQSPHYNALVLADIHLDAPSLELPAGGDPASPDFKINETLISRQIERLLDKFMDKARDHGLALGLESPTDLIGTYQFLINCGDILNGQTVVEQLKGFLDTAALSAASPIKILGGYGVFYEKLALAALEKYRNKYKIPDGRVLGIPGNHDVYRSGVLAGRQTATDVAKFRPYYDLFATKLAHNNPPASYERAPRLPCFALAKVLSPTGPDFVLGYVAFVGFDSNWEEYDHDFIENYGRIDEDQLKQFKTKLMPELTKVASDAPLYVIACMHHHLLPIGNKEIKDRDFRRSLDKYKGLKTAGKIKCDEPFSMCVANRWLAENTLSTTTNAAELIEFFQSNRISIVLHGHMHDNAVQEIFFHHFRRNDISQCVTVLACPSFAGGTDEKGFEGIVKLGLDLDLGQAHIDALCIARKQKDPAQPIQVTRPLISASRITPAENRLYFALKKYLRECRTSATAALNDEIQRFEKYVDDNMKEYGYVPICAGDGRQLNFLVPERFTRYYLLLLLKDDIEPSILLNRHLPLRLSQLADWDTLLVPAFHSIHELLKRLREDLVRQHQAIAIRSTEARKIAEHIRELGELIADKHAEEQEAGSNLIRFVAAKKFVKFSPTEAMPTEYDYTLVTFEPLVVADAADSKAAGPSDPQIEAAYRKIRQLLKNLPRVTVDFDPVVGGTVPIESIGPGGAGLRWDPAAAGDGKREHHLPLGALWFPVRTPSDRRDSYWKGCPSIVARNADVMTWIDEVLAKLTAGEAAFRPEIQLGKWPRGAGTLVIKKTLPFKPSNSRKISTELLENEYAQSTMEALRLVRYESTFDLAEQLAYADATLEIKPVFLRQSAPDRYGRIVIEVVEADASKPINEQPEAVSLGVLRPVQRYVLGVGLERAGEANAKILDKLDDPWGFARVNIPGSIRDFSVTPPIVEELPAAEWEGEGISKEFILCDGNHRVVQRVWQEGKPIQAVAVCGKLPQPFYARPFSKFEWHITADNVLPSPPDTASKYAARQMDKRALSALGKTARDIINTRPASESYRRYFRDLTTGFGYLGGQGGRLA